MDTITNIYSLFASVTDSLNMFLEMLDKLDNMYDRSLKTMLIYFTILAGLIGIIAPSVVTFIQWFRVRVKEKEIEAKLGSESKRLDSKIENSIKLIDMKIKSTTESINKLFDRFSEISFEQFTNNRVMDVKSDYNKGEKALAINSCSRLLIDSGSKEKINKSIALREALVSLRYARVDDISNKPNDMGTTYQNLTDAEENLSKLIELGFVENDEKKALQNLKNALSKKRNEFKDDQKGMGYLLTKNLYHKDES